VENQIDSRTAIVTEYFGIPRGVRMMNRNKSLFIEIQTIPPSIHHKLKEIMDYISKTTNGI
jgi:hypothetical protein